MIEYREVTVDNGEKFIVRSNENGTESWIPVDHANSDYQAYLAAQSTPSVE